MQRYIETAIQWLHDTIRVHVRARREANPPDSPSEWVGLCWEVGHSLTMMQAHGIPAQPVIEAVSGKLIDEFGLDGDLTAYGIRTMRQFYLDYFERPHLQPKIREVPWDCHKVILALCRDPMQQEFYLDLCRSESLGAEPLAAAIKERRYELGFASSKASAPKVPPKRSGRGSARLSRKA